MKITISWKLKDWNDPNTASAVAETLTSKFGVELTADSKPAYKLESISFEVSGLSDSYEFDGIRISYVGLVGRMRHELLIVHGIYADNCWESIDDRDPLVYAMHQEARARKLQVAIEDAEVSIKKTRKWTFVKYTHLVSIRQRLLAAIS